MGLLSALRRRSNAFIKRHHRRRHWVPARLGPARLALRSWFQQHVLLLGRSNATGLEHIFHCCTSKTGSQWLMSMLNDPDVVLRSGMFHYHYQSRQYLGPDPRPIRDREFTSPFPSRAIVSPVFIGYRAFQRTPFRGDYRAFFVLRDPREFLVSWYFSSKNSHVASRGVNPGMVKARETLESLSLAEGLAWGIEEIQRRGHFGAMQEWLEADDPHVRVYRFEDFVGPNRLATFADLFAFLRLPATSTQLRELLDAYSFARLSGRKPGVVDEKSHLRAGGAVTWPKYLSREHLEALGSIFDVPRLRKLGYEW